ncbi:MAG: hypothetical protein A4E57_01922 [Syntrophorhabdaceae bacterium PtaU1.Bin034]|nr:MAG: hypothetical protein A4E57_01922 [Syntrophorhabdaceae bacterium PtaU1.Bin034]
MGGNLICALRGMAHIPEAQGAKRRGKAFSLPAGENGGKGRCNARRNEPAAFDHCLDHLDILTERFGLLRAHPDAGAAGNTAFFVHVRLPVLHPDGLYRAAPQAPVAVTAPGSQGKYDLATAGIRHYFSPLFAKGVPAPVSRWLLPPFQACISRSPYRRSVR